MFEGSRPIRLAVPFVAALVLAPVAGAADHPNAGTLSARLYQLSGSELRAAPPTTQARALSLPPRGAGSLMRVGDSVVAEALVSGHTAGRVDGLRRAGAKVLDVIPRYRTVTAAVPISDLRAVGQAPGVVSVHEVQTPMVGGAPGADARPGTINTCPTGVVTEGNTQLKADVAKTQFDVDGTGVKVGMLSDSFDTNGGAATHAAGDVTTGDLPGPGNPCGRTTPVQVLQDDPNEADEGRAMLQIVHDIAPGASLAFATAFLGEASFANNIHALANNGADIIGDDIIYFAEPFYQDGIIAKAIDDVSAQGVDYFTMAYNSNRIVGGRNVNSWEAPAYRATACPPIVTGGGNCMDFNPGAGTDNMFQIGVAANATIRLSLGWAEPQNGVSDDFDFWLLNAAGTALAYSSPPPGSVSNDNNFGPGGRAFEFIGLQQGGSSANYQIVIQRKSGTGNPRIKWVNSDNAFAGFTATEYDASNSTDAFGPTIFGHNGTDAAQTLGAVPFSNSATVENFSARGPVTHLFGPVVGNAVAAPLGAPQVLQKPDVSATDGGINTFFGGGHRFFGTSASTPHAAAVGALQMEANPALSATQVNTTQVATATPIPGFGTNVGGAGLVNAQAAVGANPPAAPAVSVAGPAPSNDTTPTFTFTVTGDVKSLTCSVDGGAAAPCSSPFTTGALGDGSHTVNVAATDYFGQSGAGSGSATIDATAPKLDIAKGPKKRTTKEKAKFKIDTDADASLTCKLDKKSAKTCSAKPKFKVKPGKHKLVVEATDAVGNAADATYKWKVLKKKGK